MRLTKKYRKNKKNKKHRHYKTQKRPYKNNSNARGIKGIILNPIKNGDNYKKYNNYNNKKSYSPTINDQLISLKSTTRDMIEDCNNNRAFRLEEPLKIAIPGEFYGSTCYKYNSSEARRFLLHNLSANKHIIPSIVVPPKQIYSNCWFNTMFACLFISDKGRKFFHYFRSLMIESRQANGTQIPKQLADAFALLNFAVEAALTGSKYAYELNTNSIIKKIYESIPDKYHKIYPYVVDVDNASNPIRYYGSIITYLDEQSLQFLFISKLNTDWKNRIEPEVARLSHRPHVIILEIYDDDSKKLQKPTEFKIGDIEYKLDSAVIRDTSKQHFCATITCEKDEMGYDGMSHHRLISMSWKNTINMNKTWGFEGSNNTNGTPLKWSFMDGYQLLLYYRVK
jgi:hypothetical protein